MDACQIFVIEGGDKQEISYAAMMLSQFFKFYM